MTTRILLVDDEEDILWSLQNRLGRALPGVELKGCGNGRAALECLAHEDYNLVISDVKMPEVSGIELIIEARKRNARLPFIITTAYPTEQMRMDVQRMGSVTYVEKPFEFNRLVSLVNGMLEQQRKEGFKGAVSLDTLPDLVQLFCFSSTTGGLRIWQGSKRGAIWFDRGTVVHAEAGALEGAEAFYEILSWEGGEFAMERNAEPPRRTLAESATGLLMEAQRRLDEARRARSGGGDDVPPDEWADFSEEAVSAPPPLLRALPAEAAPREPEQAPPPAPELPGAEELVADGLRRVSGMAGFTRLSLLHMGAGQAAEAPARAFREALAAAELLATGEDQLEEMLLAVESHHHLFVSVRGTRGVFFHLVMERSTGNVWLARLALKEAEPRTPAARVSAGVSS